MKPVRGKKIRVRRKNIDFRAAGFVLRYMPAIGPHGQQRLRILLNGSEIATACANIGGHHVVRRGFPATLLRSDANTLTFEFLDPVVPAEVDAMSTDTRLLAMFAETLTLEVELAPSRRRLVLLHGDAQAEALAAALGSFPPVAAAFELRCLKPETDLAGAVAGLAPTEADLLALVLEQVRSGAGPQASLFSPGVGGGTCLLDPLLF